MQARFARLFVWSRRQCLFEFLLEVLGIPFQSENCKLSRYHCRHSDRPRTSFRENEMQQAGAHAGWYGPGISEYMQWEVLAKGGGEAPIYSDLFSVIMAELILL